VLDRLEHAPDAEEAEVAVVVGDAAPLDPSTSAAETDRRSASSGSGISSGT